MISYGERSVPGSDIVDIPLLEAQFDAPAAEAPPDGETYQGTELWWNFSATRDTQTLDRELMAGATLPPGMLTVLGEIRSAEVLPTVVTQFLLPDGRTLSYDIRLTEGQVDLRGLLHAVTGVQLVDFLNQPPAEVLNGMLENEALRQNRWALPSYGEHLDVYKVYEPRDYPAPNPGLVRLTRSMLHQATSGDVAKLPSWTVGMRRVGHGAMGSLVYDQLAAIYPEHPQYNRQVTSLAPYDTYNIRPEDMSPLPEHRARTIKQCLNAFVSFTGELSNQDRVGSLENILRNPRSDGGFNRYIGPQALHGAAINYLAESPLTDKDLLY